MRSRKSYCVYICKYLRSVHLYINVICELLSSPMHLGSGHVTRMLSPYWLIDCLAETMGNLSANQSKAFFPPRFRLALESV